MISGLVLHLHADEQLAQQAIDSIENEPAIEVGELTNNRLPAVLETASPSESRNMTDWLNNLPGIIHVDVTFVHLETYLESQAQ